MNTTGVRRLAKKLVTPVRTNCGVAMRYKRAAGSRIRPSSTRLTWKTARLTGSIGSFWSSWAGAGAAHNAITSIDPTTLLSNPAAPRTASRDLDKHASCVAAARPADPSRRSHSAPHDIARQVGCNHHDQPDEDGYPGGMTCGAKVPVAAAPRRP